ncbi:MAG: SDR family NAD(P)-dependent oxidoreductase [Aliidongia sp.]
MGQSDGFQERYPAVRAVPQLYAFSGDRITCAGSSAILDMMVAWIGRQGDAGLAQEVADHLLFGRVRPGTTEQRGGAQRRAEDVEVARAVALMRDHIDETLSCQAIADRLGLSLRQLERRFKRELGRSVQQEYLLLRMAKGASAAAADGTRRDRNRLRLRLSLARIFLAAISRRLRVPTQRRPAAIDHCPGAAATPPRPMKGTDRVLDFSGKNVLVTGGARGIGAAAAVAFRARGARVAIGTRGTTSFDAFTARFGAAGFVPALGDVGDRQGAYAVVGAAVAALGGARHPGQFRRHLYRAADRGCDRSRLDRDDPDQSRRHLLLLQAALPALEAAGGNIVNLASDAGLSGFPLGAVYCASKGGVVNMSAPWRSSLPAGCVSTASARAMSIPT